MSLPNRRALFQKPASGFTLIEVLLVLSILGLLSGMLMLTPPHSQARSLESELRGFKSLLEQTRGFAVRNSEHYGIAVAAGEWQLLKFDPREARRNAWVPIAWEDISSAHPRHRWSVDTQATISENTDAPRRDYAGQGRQGVAQPDLIAYANGELSSFVIEVSASQDKMLRYKLQSDGLNLSVVMD